MTVFTFFYIFWAEAVQNYDPGAGTVAASMGAAPHHCTILTTFNFSVKIRLHAIKQYQKVIFSYQLYLSYTFYCTWKDVPVWVPIKLYSNVPWKAYKLYLKIIP